jgi:uncharacterized Zn-binding protein involved in type VI secretion
MPAAARADGNDRVFSITGAGKDCKFPNPSVVTGPPSVQVYVNGKQVVVEGDEVGDHAFIGCGPDNSTMTGGSSTVFAGGKKIARIGDNYGSDNIIISGSTNVFIGG